MASRNGVHVISHKQLEPYETALLELASIDSKDQLSLTEKESQILQLYDLIQEQELEKALLEQGTYPIIKKNG